MEWTSSLEILREYGGRIRSVLLIDNFLFLFIFFSLGARSGILVQDLVKVHNWVKSKVDN